MNINFDEKKSQLKTKKIANIPDKEKDLVLSHKDAEAASPADEAVCGEEDPGVALETLVNKDEARK